MATFYCHECCRDVDVEHRQSRFRCAPCHKKIGERIAAHKPRPKKAQARDLNIFGLFMRGK
jgi:hypothetical protein